MPERSRSSLIRAGWIWRFALAVFVSAVAIAAFRAGVGVSDRVGVPQAGLATQLYYSIGLFVLGGLDIGVPVAGPDWARLMLWSAYFAAPAITAGALIEALLRVWNPRWWRLRGLRDHVAIVGMGQIGTLYLEALRRVDAKRRVLVVDTRSDNVNVVDAQARHGALFMNGDIGNAATRQAMRLDRAVGVVIVTGSDLVNLEASTDILAEQPQLARRVVAHVADASMERTMAHLRAGGNHSGPEDLSGESDHILFNGHRIAAGELVQKRLSADFKATEAPDAVVIAGFGRFGQTILELLQTHAEGEFSTVLLIDQVADLRHRQFEQNVGFRGSYTIGTLKANLADPSTWDQAADRLRQSVSTQEDRSAVFVLGTDDDALNLKTALTLRRLRPAARIVVRCFSDSSLTRQLSKEGGFEVFAVSSLLRDALAYRHRNWFMPSGRGSQQVAR